MSDLAKPVVEQQLQLHVDVHAELEQQQPSTISSQGQLPPSPSGRASLQQQRSQGGAVPLSPTASSQTSPPQPSASQSQPSASPLQLPGSPALQQQQRERRRDKLASTLKSSVVYGGSALLSSVTAITPHLAGAVDIMVVQQPDGRLVSTPFYVRFGKYTPLRNRERDVKMYVNGELASFGMHLGSQGHAYFLEPLEPSLDNPSGLDELGRSSNLEPRVPEDDEVEVEAMLAGMMSPASGYSSGGEDGNGRSPRQLLPETALGAALSLQQLQEAQLEAVEGQVPLANMLSLRSMASDSSFGTVAGSSGMNGPAATADALARTVLSGAEQLVAQQAAQVAVVDSLVTGTTTTTATAVAVGFAQASSPREARAAAAEAAVAAATNAMAETQVAGAQALADAGMLAGHQLQDMQQQTQETQQQQQQQQQQEQQPSLSESAVPSVRQVGPQVEGVEAGEDAFQDWLRPEQGAMRRKTVSFSFQGPAEQQLQDAPSAENESFFTQQRQRVQSSPVVQCSEQQQQRPLEQEAQPSARQVAQRQGHTPGQHQGQHASPSGEGRGTSSASALPVPVPVHGFELPEGRSTYADVVRSSPADEPLGTSPSSDGGYFGDAEACQAGGSSHGMMHSPPRRPSSQPLPSASTPPAGAFPAASGAAAAAAAAQEPSFQRHSAGGVVTHLPNRTSCSAPALPALSEQQGSGSPQTPVGPATSVGGLLQTLELSMCGGLLSPQTAEEEAHQLFDRERVHADAFAKHGQEMLASPMLMVRVEGSIYPWTDVAPIFLGAVVFGCRWQHLLPALSTSWGCLPHCAPGTPGSRGEVIGPDGVKYVPKKASGSWLWPFGGWASNPNATSHSGMAMQPQGRSGSLSGMPMGAISAISAPPAMPPGLVAVSGGSPTTYASCPSAPALGSGAVGAGGVSLATASAPVYATGRLLMYPRSSSLVLTDGPKLRKVLTPSSDQLASLKLRLGRNRVSYRVGAATEVSAYMYLVRWDTKIVISDVDGTITRSDVLGHLLPAIGLDWSHPGISQLLANVSNNGYQVMYLSSRSIGQANITRDYLNTIVQGEHRMPAGPVIISPDGVLPSLYREMILRRPHEFKIATLSEIRALFPAECNPFYAGFGNRDTDEISYKAVGVPTGRIFIINPKGELRKASTTIQSSTLSTLKAINEILSTIFPPLVGPGAAHWSSTAAAGATPGSSSGEESGAAAVPVPTSGLQPAVDEHYNDLQYWGSAADTMDADAELMARYLLPSKPSTSPNSGGAGLARMGSGHLTKQPSAPAIAVSTTPASGVGQAGRQASDAIEPGVHVSAASAPAVAAAVATTASAPNSKRRSWGYGRVLRGSPPALDTTSPQPPAPKPTGSAGSAVQDRKPATPEDTQAARGGSDDDSDEEDEDENDDGDDEDSLSPRQPSDFLSSYNPFAA